jgi:type IV pilus assembly protein PilM
MANPRKAWGIDIGNRALKAVKLVRNADGRLKVSDFELIEHETPLSNAGDNRDALIQTALANFVQRRPEKGASIGVSVSGSNSLARFIKLPPVEPKKIPEIVRFEAIQQIPFPLDEVEWSHQLFQSPESPDVEVGIFAMRKELINAQLKFFTNVALNVEVVQLNPLAVYNAMQYDQRIDGATMIIDLGSENTDLIIADGETIWLRSIPVGGKNFTDILVKQFKLPFAKAEELKRTAATSKYAKQIFQAMRPVFADLVAEVQRSIGFYASVHRDSRLKRVLALGGTFRLPGLQKYLQQNLQLEVARIDRLEAGGPEEAKQRAAFEENLLSLASAYGLAIQAMGDAKITSSLLPESIRRQKMWSDKTPWFAATAAACLVGSGVALGSYFLQNLQYDQNKSVRDHITEVLTLGTHLDQQWSNDVEQQGAGDRQRIANVESMLWFRDLWPGLMSDIQSCLPTPSNPLLLSGDWGKIKAATKRSDRDMIMIDSITSVFDTDLSKIPGTAPGAPGDASGQAAAAGAAPLPNLVAGSIPAGAHGFRLTINLVTPFGVRDVEAYNFVEKSFVSNLRAMGVSEAKAGKDYMVVYADVTRWQSVAADAPYLQQLASRLANRQLVLQPPAANPGGGAAAAPQAAVFGMGAAPAAAPTQYLDPLTGEDMTKDTVIEVTALVMVGPPGTLTVPAPPPATPAQ